MAPKRRVSGPAAKSQQSTLAFHGGANKVTKHGARAQDVKKDLLSKSTSKAIKPDVVDLETVEEVKPTTVEADIIDQVEKEVAVQKAESSPEDEAAGRIADSAIKKYWASKEKQRLAPRVHQHELSLHEKVLREFDMSAQYGPCTGIARLKRWKRAHRLELEPPIEVLAVLLKEQESAKDKLAVQRSHVDELLNTRTEIEA
ncbi:DNA polymerase delta, subunit 4-domain-containing protein [Boeremia exigua]|uniref:DNA polymerase delta, subunit 4-domain-containing protein n=1 Tax=Boeremia exigua TaxID=749465 RepID=UPI001E8E37DE|nr:DNA polymerase delta, subunit 4-domain-containing protein [Boeremia exigua]KAH6614202.1 DNA polymerase delta, subunit 4-domain-containing protein [Boeremia exigua]